MGDWKELTRESRDRWETNAEYWDDYMGEHDNRFARELIRPRTEEQLEVAEGRTILDIGCGNGNFSRRLAERGAKVEAVDYSPKMIERAKQRSHACGDRIEYRVVDATSYEDLIALGIGKFDAAVANMVLMDMADVSDLPRALAELLKDGGMFVFSIMHPCFQPPGLRKIHETEEIGGEIVTRSSVQISKYLTPEPFESIGIRGQPVPHFVFHRPLAWYMNLFFDAGFVLDGFAEPHYERKPGSESRFDWIEFPPAAIFRFRKPG